MQALSCVENLLIIDFERTRLFNNLDVSKIILTNNGGECSEFKILVRMNSSGLKITKVIF